MDKIGRVVDPSLIRDVSIWYATKIFMVPHMYDVFASSKRPNKL